MNSSTLSPDLILLDANVITMDSKHPKAEAFAILNGKVVAVGDNQVISKLGGVNTEVINANKRTIVPGFIDAHMHPRLTFGQSEDAEQNSILNLSKVRTLEELEQAVHNKAKVTQNGHWIVGINYDDQLIDSNLTSSLLDRATGVHLVIIYHVSLHRAVVNTKVLERIGIIKDSESVKGDGYVVDDNGELTGEVLEQVAWDIFDIFELKSRVGPPFKQQDKEVELARFRKVAQQFVAAGITSISDAAGTPEALNFYQRAVDFGIPLRINIMMHERYFKQLSDLGIRSGFGDNMIRLGAIKLFHGNSLSGKTCWLYEPYADRPEYYGEQPSRTQKQLDELITDIHQKDFQIAVHSNGDREIDMVLSAYEKALNSKRRADHRHRIEHASVVNKDILLRAKKLGIILVPHSYIYEHGEKMEAYGANRWEWMHPNRTALDIGIKIAGNSDYPVSEANPMLRLQSMTTRKAKSNGKVYGKTQRVTALQGLEIWTMGSAYAQFNEDIIGSITPGKLADFVMLSADPTNTNNETLGQIKVMMTVINGHIVYNNTSGKGIFNW